MNPAFIQGIGPLELVIVLAIVLLVFGPKRLPAVGRSLASGVREFKRSFRERHDDEPRQVAQTSQDRSVALDGEVVSERR